MSLLDDLVNLAKQVGDDAKRFVGQATTLFQDQLQQHPREVYHLLRVVRPVFVNQGVAFVTRYPDVVEVLTHDREFSVSEYAPPMERITGDFILGLNQGPQRERDISLLHLAFRQDDVPTVAALVRSTVDELVAQALPLGQIDVVTDLCDRVPARMVEKYLGAPGPDEDTLIRWARALFAEIFVNPKHDRVITEQALAAAAEIRPYLDDLVRSRKAALRSGASPTATVLDRLLSQQVLGAEAFTDIEIRSNLIGLLVGMIPTTSKAAALAIDELLRRPREWKAARAAVEADDSVLLSRYVNEAMRFAPQAPGLIRTAAVDYRIARGTHHETLIPAGTLVFAATQSAMMDGAIIESPDEFRIDRPSTDYLHFGAGVHTCFGRYVNMVSIPAIVRGILSLDGAQRVPGAAGELAIDGNFPTSMTLEFTPQHPHSS
jgi:cytochrome P450